MIHRYFRRTLLNAVAFGLLACGSVSAQEFLTPDGLDQLGVQRYWHARFPIPAQDPLNRAVIIDDAVYLITGNNVTLAVHSKTGVIRWTNLAAEPGQTVRGPTHSDDFAIFTGAASVKSFNRRTGELQGVPRRLSGFIVEVSHDIARISIGEVHGLRLDDTLDVMNVDDSGEPTGDPIAQVKVTYVEPHQAKGRLIRDNRATVINSGKRVFGQKVLPVESTVLPTAASSAAVADGKSLYVGLANERLSSIELTTGFINWQVAAPRTVTATPIIHGDDLYFANQEGEVISCTKADRIKNWIYKTEGPIFVDLAVSENYVYAASDDRSLYCLDRKTGHRVWRKQFDNPPAQPPYLASDRVYQHIPGEGLFVLDAKTGKEVWSQREGGRFLSQFGNDIYLVQEDGEHTLQRVDAKTGQINVRATIPMADYVVASQSDQLILLFNKLGQAACLRPKNAPPLHPGELAQVLRDDRKLELAAALKKESKTNKAPTAIEDTPLPKVDVFGSDDWLTDHTGNPPVGGSGLVDVGQPKQAAEKGKKPAAKDDDKKKKDSDEADRDEDESDDDKKADDDSENEGDKEEKSGDDDDSGDDEDESEEDE